MHRPFEAHLDIFQGSAATVINLPLPVGAPRSARFRSRDVDAAIRLAEHDPETAAALLLCAASEDDVSDQAADWPDLLASCLRADQSMSIGAWGEHHGFAPATVSRGFLRTYGTTPARYRAEARARTALEAVVATALPLAQIAAAAGFSDQAHMTRSISALSCRSPGKWRAEVKSLQDGAAEAA